MEIQAITALAHVASVPRSIAFYERLGFAVRNTHVPTGASEPVWARVECGRADLMLARAVEPVEAARQGVLFYLYCEDVGVFRARLADDGLEVGAITYPFWSPRGEFRMVDPDGYVLMVTHT